MKELNRYCLGDDGLEVSADGPWVLHADAQAALAEKDERIAELEAQLADKMKGSGAANAGQA